MSAALAAKPSLPVYPEQQTLSPAVGGSLKGHKRKRLSSRKPSCYVLLCPAVRTTLTCVFGLGRCG
jgi:hypothetical protein